MKIRELMTNVVTTVHLDDRLSHVRQIFLKNEFHHLLAVDSKGHLAGVLSDRDLLKAISPHLGLASETSKDIATLNKRVHQIACRKVLSLPSNATLAAAVKMFHHYKVTCIPIVNEHNIPIGIITTKDIMKYLYDKITPTSKNNAEFNHQASNASRYHNLKAV